MTLNTIIGVGGDPLKSRNRLSLRDLAEATLGMGPGGRLSTKTRSVDWDWAEDLDVAYSLGFDSYGDDL